MNNQNNNGCGCNCNHSAPAPSQSADISMKVCDRNANVLPMLQTYTTKVLKPNISSCCKKNILTQQMMGCEGYKYIIKWDFDLNGQTITVPERCILEFDGGSLKNGTIVGNNTSIFSSPVVIFDDVILSGTFAEDLVINNFSKANNCAESAYNISKAIHVIGTYVVDEPIVVRTGLCVYGDDMYKSRLTIDPNYNGIKTVFMFANENAVITRTFFKNLEFYRCDYAFYRDCGSTDYATQSVSANDFENLYFTNIRVSSFYIKGYGFTSSHFVNCLWLGDNESYALDVNVYHFNNNTFDKCRCSGHYKGFLNVHAEGLDAEGNHQGEVNKNTIINSYFENITLPESVDEDKSYLIKLYAYWNLHNFIVENNYFERIYESHSEGGVTSSIPASLINLSMLTGRIPKNIQIEQNMFVTKFTSVLDSVAAISSLSYIGNGPDNTQTINASIYSLYKGENSSSLNVNGTVTNDCNLSYIPTVKKEANESYLKVRDLHTYYHRCDLPGNGEYTTIDPILPSNSVLKCCIVSVQFYPEHNPSVPIEPTQVHVQNGNIIIENVRDSEHQQYNVGAFRYVKTFEDEEIIVIEAVKDEDTNRIHFKITNTSSTNYKVNIYMEYREWVYS